MAQSWPSILACIILAVLYIGCRALTDTCAHIAARLLLNARLGKSLHCLTNSTFEIDCHSAVLLCIMDERIFPTSKFHVSFNAQVLPLLLLQVHQQDMSVLKQQLADALAHNSSLTGDIDIKLAELEAASTEVAALRESAEIQLQLNTNELASVKQALAVSTAACQESLQASVASFSSQCCVSIG